MKKNIKRLVLLLITIVFLYFVCRNVDLKQLLHEMKSFDVKFIPLLIISILTGLTMRGVCFKLLISKSVKAPLSEMAQLCITCAALNIFLPARAGDLFRAFYVGDKYNIDKIKMFGAIILERVFDGLVILSLLLLAIFCYNNDEPARTLCLGAAAIFITCFILAILAIKFNKIDTICTWIEKKTSNFPNKLRNIISSLLGFVNRTCNSFISGFEILQYPKSLMLVILASFSIWIFECLNHYLVIAGFNCNVDWSVVLFIIPFISLACMIPSTSIFIGPYQFAILAAFAIYGVPKETALAISIFEQTFVVIVSAIVAAIFLLKNNFNYKEIQQDVSNTLSNK